MDVVDTLLGAYDWNRDPLHKEAADEIIRLRMMLKSQYEKNKSISELTPTEKDTLDIVDALTYCGDNDTIWPGLCYKAANEIISLEIEVGLLRSIKRAYDPVSQGKNI